MVPALSLANSNTTARQRLVVALLVVAIVSSFILFWRLGDKPLENWDEGIHANVTLEMYRQGAWLDLSYRDELYTAKPPLSFWMRAALFTVFGETELAIRLWSAVAGVATTLLLSYWAWQVFGNARMAVLTGVLFVTGRYVLFHAFRTGETDGLFMLFFVAAMYAYWRSVALPPPLTPPPSARHSAEPRLRRGVQAGGGPLSPHPPSPQRGEWIRWWFIWFGLLTGLAVMTKSFAGAIPAIIVATDMILGRRWRSVGWRTIGWSALAAVVVTLPWHLLELVRHGREFWQSYFGFHILERAGEALYANQVPWYWYAEIIGRRMFPVVAFVPLAVLLGARRWLRSRDELDRLLLVWAAAVFSLFSVIQTKFDWYVLPIYPALVLLLARAVWELVKRPDWLLTGGFLVSLAAAVYGLPLGLAHEGLLWQLTPYSYLPAAALSSGGRVVVGLTTAAVVWLVVALLRRWRERPLKAVTTLSTIYVVALALGWQISYLRHLPTSSPLQELAGRLDHLKAGQVDVVGVKLLTQPAGYFYLRRAGVAVREVTAETAAGPYVLTTTASRDQFGQGRAILERDRFVLLELISAAKD
ncbi:MAG: glycosyltransferase family 39 protein [Candidatus Kerfeldbacteria bacterium]|nr:glycosyltransferase family 39 protein [Candidatus Kerfeldbacteria bacterium]